MRWLLPESRKAVIGALAEALGLHPLAATVLANRGFAQRDEASAFLSDRLSELPNPMTMKGAAAASTRLCRALSVREKITLYGDYDVDGVASTALLTLFLREVGGNPSTYIPHRLGEGYGLNLSAIEKIAADGTKVLVALDCGITSCREIARAQELGVDVIVVDHHSVPDPLPPAFAILNPLQPGCEYPTKHLCAAGVAFNLCMAVRRQLRVDGLLSAKGEPNLKSFLDLVALATVADVVPLTGANRILVKHGLEELSRGRRPGVAALKLVAGLGEQSPVTTWQVGFRLGPRINAAGRLDDASIGLRLLCAPSLETARPLARALDVANHERQEIEARILDAAMRQAEKFSSSRGLVLAGEGWHPGVIGIVASRVVERFHRPTVLVGLQGGTGRGSARSISGFNLIEALGRLGDHLVQYGGHRYAAGLTIEGPRLEGFRRAFDEVARSSLTEEDLIPTCKVDGVVGLSDLDQAAIESVSVLAPFGCGNPEPIFVSRRLEASPRLLASKKNGEPGHLKLKLQGFSHLDVIGFGMAEKIGLTEGPVDLAYQVGFDDWGGSRRLTLKLKDLRSAAG